MGGPVTIEAATSTTQLRRFRELPYLLHGDDPRWRPPVRAFDNWRLDTRRHAYFERGDAAFFLARRGGIPVGRIAAHHPGGDRRHEGGFAYFAAADDAAVVRALIGAASEWLAERGTETMVGPVSWAAGDDEAIRVAGHELPALTGRPWQPTSYEHHLVAVGATRSEFRPSWLVPVTGGLSDASSTSAPGAPPPHAGAYGDPALVLDDIAGVPDVSDLLAPTSVRGAWARARRARNRQHERAVCVRCDGEPGVLVPRLIAAAAAAGYRELVGPVGDGEPDLAEATFRIA